MKKRIRLTESHINRIIRKIIFEQKITDYGELYDALKKTKLYKYLNKTTKMIYRVGRYWDNSGGGSQLVFFDKSGKEVDSRSVNNFNKSRLLDYLVYIVKNDIMTRSMRNELESIQERRVGEYRPRYINDVDDLIRYICDLITRREEEDDTYEDMIDRYFEDTGKCEFLKDVDEQYFEKYKQDTIEDILRYYNISSYDYNEFLGILANKISQCRG